MLGVSIYDSIKIRDDYWREHTQEIVETIHNHCEREWQN